jgi:deoxycytidylate deaminase
MTDREIMAECYEAASCSPCKKGKVGACVVGMKDGDAYSQRAIANTAQRGSEWLPVSIPEYALQPLKCEAGCLCGKALHAEMRALAIFELMRGIMDFWKVSDFDSITLYTTCHPCAKCLREIMNFGVTHLVIGTGAAKEEADREALWQAMEDGLEVRYIL